MNRRPLILGACTLAIAATFGIIRSTRPKRIKAKADAIETVIAREFGDRIAQSSEARRFATEAETASARDILEFDLILAFLRTTNVVRALETGDDLIFLGFDGPITAPCQNTLSAGWI